MSNDAGGPFAGATWIWRTPNPRLRTRGSYATFERGFTLPGPPTSGSILITADNGYQASLNGTLLGSARLFPPFFTSGNLTDSGVQSSDWWTPGNLGLAPLKMGANTLSVIAANEAAYPDLAGSPTTTGIGGAAKAVIIRPGGLLVFKAQASYLAKSASAWTGARRTFPAGTGRRTSSTKLQDALVETVTVPATLPDGPGGVTSTTALATGSSYEFKITGTGTWTNRTRSMLWTRSARRRTERLWAAAAVRYPDGLLELQVNSLDRNWDRWGPFATATDALTVTSTH